MPALAAGQARGLASSGYRPRRAVWIRVARRLGFFVLGAALAGCGAALAGCAASPAALARDEDARYHTAAFSWLVEHDPATVVAWRIPAARLAALIPDARVLPASGDAPCAQAAHAHAALFLAAPRSATALRDRAEDCGVALFRDSGALVIAPR